MTETQKQDARRFTQNAMTEKQKQAIEIQKKRWDVVHDSFAMIAGGGAVVLPVGGTKEKPQMYLAIETDGYTHS
jgi:hypothetical protein